MTYGELNALADQFAGYLSEHGVRNGCGVAVSLRRSEWLLISILATLKCGAYYVPISPEHPREWRAHIVRDSDVVLVITDDDDSGSDAMSVPRVSITGYHSLPPTYLSQLTEGTTYSGDDTCYLLYTSGTTGRPKGVPIAHRNVSHLLWALAERLGVAHRDRWLAATTMTFDIAALEWFMPLTTGATVILSTDEESRSPLALRRVLMNCGATILQGTPALWRILLESGPLPASLRNILCGGDTLPADLASRLVADPAKVVWNLYGPTETTIWSTAHRLDSRKSGDKPPIGIPLGDTQIYILDADLRLVRTGQVGELFIGGPGLSNGYWKRPDLTAQAFINVSAVYPRTLYRTGDLVRMNAVGELEFIGRGDRQVKVRGYRIELAEVEAVLLDMPGIEAAVAAVRYNPSGDARLWVFVAPRPGIEVSAQDIRSYVSARVPEYKVPSGVVWLRTIPLTANGKVDHQALLESLAGPHTPEDMAATSEPGNETERKLCSIWAEELRLVNVSTCDDFFSLGGDSMFAAMIMIRIAEEFGVQMALDDFLDNPTIKAMATFVDRQRSSEMVTAAVVGTTGGAGAELQVRTGAVNRG